jgi:hypothetical protein
MRSRLGDWGYTGASLADNEVRGLWEEVGSLPPAVRQLRLDPTTYPAYRDTIRKGALDPRPSIRAIERVAEAGPRHLDAATARAERTLAAMRARGLGVIRGSELSREDRHEVLGLLDDQSLRLQELLAREVSKARGVPE